MDITSLPPHLSPENSSDARFGENRQRINTLQRELAEVFFLLLKKRRAAVGGKSLPAKTTLKLSLELSQADSPETSSDQLYLQLVRAVDRFMTGSAFPPGHVYCHWCRSFSCEHSVPPDPRSVFGGYTATGQPTWPEFVSVLLDRRHPRIDEIFREDPSPITLVEDGKGLSSEQLPIYGKRSFIYRILGQVVLGYVLYPNGLFLGSSPSSRRLPVAITIQAVETMNDAGPLLLNVVGKLPDGASAFQAFEE